MCFNLKLHLIKHVYLSGVQLHGVWLGIRGTHLKSSIQDIVDEVAPIKKSPPMGLRADSFKYDVTRLIRGL